MCRITGVADSTPSICLSRSTYLVLRDALEEVTVIEPLRVKIISPRTFVDRRCKSFDIPRVNPVNSITSATPSATPMTLIAERKGRCRMFEVTRLSKTFMPFSNGKY
jgi:hypothetical protein